MPTYELWSSNVEAFATKKTKRDFEQPRTLWRIICGHGSGKEQFLLLLTLYHIPLKLQDQTICRLVLLIYSSESEGSANGKEYFGRLDPLDSSGTSEAT